MRKDQSFEDRKILLKYILREQKASKFKCTIAMAGMTKNRIGTQRGEVIFEGAFFFSYI